MNLNTTTNRLPANMQLLQNSQSKETTVRDIKETFADVAKHVHHVKQVDVAMHLLWMLSTNSLHMICNLPANQLLRLGIILA